METTNTTKFDYRYSFAGRAAWERKTKKKAADYLGEVFGNDGQNFGYPAMQDLHWMLTYHKNKGAVAIEDIEFEEDEISTATTEMLAAILDWMKAREEKMAPKSE